MTLTMLVLICIAVMLASVAINILVLWLCCFLWRVKELTLRRVVTLSMILIAIQFVLYAILLSVAGGFALLDDNAATNYIFTGVGTASIVASWLAIKRALRVGKGRAAGILATSMLLNQVAAIIMALGLRATVVEAFVIPTGGMAPTVIGQHLDVKCPHCGREFAVGMSPFTVQSEGWPPYRGEALVNCLNCGHADIRVGDHPLRSGDRILVDKIDRTLERWQLVVFHPPPDKLPFGPPAPGKVSYIDRLVGMPGEEVEIFDGDIYIDGEILKKLPDEIEDLWLSVYDSNFTGEERIHEDFAWNTSEWQQPVDWKRTDNGWEIDRTKPESVLKYTGPYWDEYQYSLPIAFRERGQSRGPVVRDWRFSITIEKFEGDGCIGFTWNDAQRRLDCLVTTLGDVMFSEELVDVESLPAPTASLSRPLRSGTRLTFAVRDHVAYLLEDDRVVASISVGPTTIEDAKAIHADQEQLVDPTYTRLLLWDCKLSVSRIQLDREVHYRTLAEMDDRYFGRKLSRWTLADDEYFFLGDNSPNSQDCRFFGPVKKDAITGVATWCYWPRDHVREFP